MRRSASWVAIVFLVACGGPDPVTSPHAAASSASPPPPPPPALVVAVDAGAPVADAAPPAPSVPHVDAAPILARHRKAVGGDAAIAKAARMRVKQRVKEYGLDSVETIVVDGARMRSDSKTPALNAEQVQLWDGRHLLVRGWNGDVRRQGPSDRRHMTTSVSLLTYAYLRDPATRIDARPPVDEGGKTFDRLVVTPPGGAAAELWIGQDGLLARVVVDKGGRVKTRFVEASAKYGELVMPKTIATGDAMLEGRGSEVVESVELLDAVQAATFTAPETRSDVVFPKGTTSVTLPVGILMHSYLAIAATVRGKTGTFLLDTGASSSVFDDDFLDALGVKPLGGTSFATQAAFKGLRFARVPEMDVAGMKLGSQVVLAIPLRKTQGFPLPVDGILGYDFWARLVTTVDYPIGTVTFQKPGTFVPDPSDVAVPVELEGTILHVPVSVNGKPAGTFELDTGNGSECMIHRFPGVETIVPKGAHPLRYARGVVYGSSASAGYATTVDLAIGSPAHAILFKSAPVMVVDPTDPAGAATGSNGNIGASFLRSFRATFDYEKTTVYLRQKRVLRTASHVATLGMNMSPDAKGALTISETPEGWPAAKAGLRPGDVLLSVDGVAPTTGSTGLEEMVPGESRTVRVKRGAETIETTLTAERWP